MTFEDIHRMGARRHTQKWVDGNRAALSVLWGTGIHPDDPEMARLISLMVLRVLDVTQ